MKTKEGVGAEVGHAGEARVQAGDQVDQPGVEATECGGDGGVQGGAHVEEEGQDFPGLVPGGLHPRPEGALRLVVAGNSVK